MAWDRVRAARLALEIPEVVERIASGELNLSSAGELWRTLQEERQRLKEKPNPGAARTALQPAFELRAAGVTASAVPGVPGTPAASGATERKPVGQAEKAQMLRSVLGKSRRESESVLREWKKERMGVKELPKPRPSSVRKSHTKEWTELELYMSSEELGKFDRLRDLLSHRLGTRDPNAVMGWLLELGLEKVDPIRQEARALKRAAKEKIGGGAKVRTANRPEVGADTETAARAVNEAGPETKAEARAVAHTKTRKDHETPSAAPLPGDHAAERCLFPDAQLSNSNQPNAQLPAPHSSKTRSPREPITARLRRRNWANSNERCQFQDEVTGRVCGATAFLDADHITEVRNGGKSTESNLRLLCRAHNRRRHLWE